MTILTRYQSRVASVAGKFGVVDVLSNCPVSDDWNWHFSLGQFTVAFIARDHELNQLADYIRQHGFDAYIRRGKLFGRMVWITPERKILTVVQPIPASLKAVREWLGY